MNKGKIVISIVIVMLMIGIIFYYQNRSSKVQYFSSIYDKVVKHDDQYIHNDKIYSIYEDIISNKLSFNNDYFDEKITLDNVKFDDYTLKVDNFGFVDMDDDNIPELIINMSLNNASEFILVIHVEEEVNSYFFSIREMQIIKKDGFFLATCGAAYNFIEKLDFKEHEYELIILAETDYDEDLQVPIYYINNKKVSEVEGKEYFQTFLTKEDIEMYSIEN